MTFENAQSTNAISSYLIADCLCCPTYFHVYRLEIEGTKSTFFFLPQTEMENFLFIMSLKGKKCR